MILTLHIIVLLNMYHRASSNTDAKILHKTLMEKYQKRIRPVQNSSDRLTVKLGLRLSQLIGVDEKNQIMTTNVWLSQEWNDFYLKWNSSEYGELKELHIPASDIWTPDIVLYNNADGSFIVTSATKATVYSDGRIVWEPPAIYKSFCAIDVEFFPFDEQTCSMKFGSWTYVGHQVDIKHTNQADIDGAVDIPYAIDMSEYYPSFIWDVMAAPARRNELKDPCCPGIFVDVTFNITIRRKTLFYTVNLIIPCVAISFFTVVVFYLPTDSGEKITLCISIMLSLTVFFLLLSELIPPTSLVIPLIGKYLLFTMILVTLSCIITIINLNLHHRSVHTHIMPHWFRVVFLEKLPFYLCLQRPESSTKNKTKKKFVSSHKSRKKSLIDSLKLRGEETEILLQDLVNKKSKSALNRSQIESAQDSKSESPLPSELERAISAIHFIADHVRNEDYELQVKEDWKYATMVVDRLFLWIFTIVCFTGTAAIFLQAPSLFDDRRPLQLS